MTLGTGKKATHGNTTRATFSALTGKQRKAGLPRSPNLRGYQVMLAPRNEVTCAFNRTPSHNDCWTMSEPSILHGAGMWSCCAEAVLWRRCLWDPVSLHPTGCQPPGPVTFLWQRKMDKMGEAMHWSVAGWNWCLMPQKEEHHHKTGVFALSQTDPQTNPQMFCFIPTRSCIRKGRATNQGLGSRSCQEPTHNVTVGYPAAYNQETNRNGSIVRSSLHYITIFEIFWVCSLWNHTSNLVASPSWKTGFSMLSRKFSVTWGFASGWLHLLPSKPRTADLARGAWWLRALGPRLWRWDLEVDGLSAGPWGGHLGHPWYLDPMGKVACFFTDLTLTPWDFCGASLILHIFLYYGQVSMVFVRIHDASGSRFSWQWSSGLYVEDPAWNAKQYCNFCFFEILSLDHLQIIVCFRQHVGINEDQSWCRPSPELYHGVDPPKRK